MGDPNDSYATAGIALRILEVLKPPHPYLPILHQGEDVIEGSVLHMAPDNIGHFPLNCYVYFTLINVLTGMAR